MKKSTAALVVAHIISTSTKVAILISLTRVGGFEVAGSYTLALAVVTPVFILFGLSLRQIFVTAREEPYFIHFLQMRVVYGLGGVLTVCGIAWVAYPDGFLIFLAMSVLRFIELLVDVNIAFVQRNDKVFLMAVMTVLSSLATSTILVGSFLLTQELATSVLAACGAAVCVLGVVSTLGPKRNPPERRLPTRSYVIRTSRSGLMLAISGFSVSMGTNIPVLLLGSYHSPAEVGVYSAIYNLSAVSNILYSSVAQAELRGFSKLAEDSQLVAFLRRGRTLSWALLAPALVGTVAIFLIGPEIFSWVFGPDFSSQQGPLRIMAVTVCIAPFGFMLDVQLTALHKYSVQGLLSVVTLVLTLVLSFLLIPGLGVIGCTLVALSVMAVRNVAKHALVRRALRVG